MRLWAQDTCHRVPLTPIFILNNPTLLPGPGCSSTFRGVPYWYPASTEMLTFFLSPCTNYLVNDTSYIAGTKQSPVVGILPIVPQPVPDGKGVIAVGDYGFAPGSIHVNPTYKSFASTCLTQILQKDSLYRFDFYAGFGEQGNQYIQLSNDYLGPQFSTTRETFGLFGMADCSGVDNPVGFYGCVGRIGWIPLGEVTVTGVRGHWTKASMFFTPPIDVAAISIGPSCDTNFSNLPFFSTANGKTYSSNRYAFFLDSLQFYAAVAPPPLVNLVSGDSCAADVVLGFQPAVYYARSSLQWFQGDSLLGGETGDQITIPHGASGADTFRCRVQNDSLCLVSNPIVVDWVPVPGPAALGSPDTTVCQSDTLVLRDAADSNLSFRYQWQDGSTLPFLTVTQPGTYSVSITDACGTTTAQKVVRFAVCDYEVFVPNAFSPNNDGHNDLFRATFFHPPTRFLLQVFSRDGLELYSSRDPGRGWDGNFGRQRQPAGTYIWTVRYTDGKGKERSLTGTVILVR